MPDTMKAQKAPITPLTSGTTELPVAMLTAVTAILRRQTTYENNSTPTTNPPRQPHLLHHPALVTFAHGVAALPAAIV
jgi:hypothetical protein